MPKKSEPRVLENIDIYLFTLLRRMIEFEITGSLNAEPKVKQVFEYIKTKFPIGDETERINVANFFQRWLWKDKPENITEERLNQMVKLVPTFGDFSDWETFKLAFNKPYLPRVTINMNEDYDLNHVRHATNAEMTVLYFALLQRGKFPHISKKKIPFCFNQLEYTDITIEYRMYKISKSLVLRYSDFYHMLSSYKTNGYAALEEWFDKNQNIFFVCIRPPDTWLAGMTFLPIKQETYLELKSGTKIKTRLVDDDLYSPLQKDQTEHIFIEALFSFSIFAISQFRDHILEILKYFVDLNKPYIVLCAISCTTQSELLLRQYGFVKTSSDAKLSHDVTQCDFFETTWGDLRMLIWDKWRLTEFQDLH